MFLSSFEQFRFILSSAGGGSAWVEISFCFIVEEEKGRASAKGVARETLKKNFGCCCGCFSLFSWLRSNLWLVVTAKVLMFSSPHVEERCGRRFGDPVVPQSEEHGADEDR